MPQFRELLNAAGMLQEEPKLFDVYVRPGLDVHDAMFERILPLAARVVPKRHVPPVTNPSSSPPSAPRTHYQLRSQKVDKAETPNDEDVFKTYDVAVLITMPRSHVAGGCDRLGEYVLGTTSLVAPTSSVPS